MQFRYLSRPLRKTVENLSEKYSQRNVVSITKLAVVSTLIRLIKSGKMLCKSIHFRFLRQTSGFIASDPFRQVAAVCFIMRKESLFTEMQIMCIFLETPGSHYTDV